MTVARINQENELEQAFQIRKEVFVKEQGVPLEDEFDEFDTLDGAAQHILVYHENAPAGTARIRWVDGFGKLERICILPPYRQLGLGKVIVAALEEIAAEQEVAKVKLHGQTQAEGFYKKLGYETASQPFLEDGILHVVMTKALAHA
ncbi:GNAT family N-acetyltransferase [Ectobacillus ponti]|uniref:GNAT family N-acetyltransferase n=1 Tax=Ectobacillus ponti TaxID=2961894 RepID=A0AA41XBX9_9BACI|nr:GNAT family N-acetyltransferase [Ectobacillus ponti]MCP8970110.1 GNAT family N-acetyltransferase [Ectobacillus ponti]